jgi:hypothetical protein
MRTAGAAVLPLFSYDLLSGEENLVFPRLCVPFVTAVAAIIVAAPAVAMPADQCARLCSGHSDYQRCMSSCLETE